jgi:hypothetical protein
MKRFTHGRLYDTDKARLVAHSDWNMGRKISLHRTDNGEFFACYWTQWEGEWDVIEPLTIEEAKGLYERLPVADMAYTDAFGAPPPEA